MDLSLVVAKGNSVSDTLGIKSLISRKAANSVFQAKFDAVRSNTADDRFFLVESGLTWGVGEDPPLSSPSVISPSAEPDVEKYFVELRNDWTLGGHRTWHAGASWDRDADAGILSRTILFAGLGNVVRDEEKLKFKISYGFSYTDRDEETPDPAKDAAFAGARLDSAFTMRLGASTTVENMTTVNMNLSDASDYNFNMTNSVSVAMSKHLALKASLQWFYNNEPALEDLDVIARVDLIDPDGVPGSGDEYYQTLLDGGIEIEIGEGQNRKDTLDTIVRTSLAITW